MRRISFAIVSALLLLTTTATTLYAQMTPRSPAPELKKLDFMSGDWTAEGTMTAGPPGTPASKWSMTSHAEWMEGNYY
ncbi:MAG TPA: hypothetical protein VJV74_03470, partial [Terriglobia bacterium]|nr:hypothetical protein [Terriglobia bacterium]